MKTTASSSSTPSSSPSERLLVQLLLIGFPQSIGVYMWFLSSKVLITGFFLVDCSKFVLSINDVEAFHLF